MNNVIITTESCSDLPKELLDQHHIPIVAFGVNFPDHSVLDGEIPVSDIYDFYKKTRSIPKSNAVSPYQYTQFFEQVAEANPNKEIIHIGYSSACSCSFQNAVIGADECVKAKVHLVDSLNVSGGLGNLTLKACQIVDENPNVNVEQILEMIRGFVPKIQTSFVPERMEFLVAGGRVSNTAALGASIFKIKPRIDIIKGELIAAKKYRGMMRQIMPAFVADFCKDRNFDKSCAYIVYALGAQQSVLDEVKECLQAEGFQKVLLFELGCVMTIHGGKGAIGISATEI